MDKKNMDLGNYFQRIAPIVGEILRTKSIAIINPQLSAPVADALARCGLTKQLFLFNQKLNSDDVFSLSYGPNQSIGCAGAVLKSQITNHNKLMKQWDILVSPAKKINQIICLLQDRKIDLIIGGGTYTECKLLDSLTKQTGIPSIAFGLWNNLSVSSGIFVNYPGLISSWSINANLITPEHFLTKPDINQKMNWLECLDVVMNIAKALLLRGSKYERSDFNDLFFTQNRTLVLRGSKNWPWQINYLQPEAEKEYLKKIFSTIDYSINYPLELIKQQRIMLIGCGTGSLLAGELVNYFNHLLLADYKNFSIYNPVRQLIGTEEVDRGLKPEILQNFLVQRYFPKKGLKIKNNQLFRTITNQNRSISATELHLTESDKNSITKFNAILDEFQPDLVIVAMGKTYDDNFVACDILQSRGIRHIIPSAFPGATYFKTIAVDNQKTPCYNCLQNRLVLDLETTPELNREAREMFYFDSNDPTQPATIFETWPSSHAVLRLTLELSLPMIFRSSWFTNFLDQGKNCFVGGNMSSKSENSESYAYGIKYPGQSVVYGVGDLVGTEKKEVCPICGRENITNHLITVT